MFLLMFRAEQHLKHLVSISFALKGLILDAE